MVIVRLVKLDPKSEQYQIIHILSDLNSFQFFEGRTLIYLAYVVRLCLC